MSVLDSSSSSIRRRGRDPFGVRFAEPLGDDGDGVGSAPAFNDNNSSGTPSNSAALNMTQEVQDLLQQVDALRHKKSSSFASSPRSIIDVIDDESHNHSCRDSSSTSSSAEEGNQEQDETKQTSSSLPSIDESSESDERLISSFHLLSVIDEEEGEESKNDTILEDRPAQPPPPTAATLGNEMQQDNTPLIDNTAKSANSRKATDARQGGDDDDDDNDVEALLQAARAERNAARQWAQSLRRAVYQWVQQQKSLVKHYQQQQVEQQQQKGDKNRDDREDLWGKLEELEEKLQTQEEEHRRTETALRAIIREQQAKLERLDSMKEQQQADTNGEHEALLVSKGERHDNDLPPKTTLTVSAKKALLQQINAGVGVSPSKSTSTKGSKTRRCISTKDCRIITYGNGAVKEIYRDITVLRFPNGDVQTETPVDRAYYYFQTGAIQVNYAQDDNVTEYHYPNGQIEVHWNDGHKTVLYPDGTLQSYAADGTPLPTAQNDNTDISTGAVTI